MKKKLGIIGGMGSVAAAYLFKRIIELTPAKNDQDYIEIFLHNNTCVPDRTEGILYDGPSPLPELKRSVKILDECGVDYIIIACVTSHYFIEKLKKEASAEIIDVAEVVADTIHEKYTNIKNVGLLATSGTVKTGIFQRKLHIYNIDTVNLNDEEIDSLFMDAVYNKEWGIKTGNTKGKPRELFLKAVEILQNKGAEAIIAGCTEVPLVISERDMNVPFLDSIELLNLKAVSSCLNK
jgi:aspartate racemase